MLTQQPFRVVLTDYFAPSGDGLALLRYIRQTTPGTPGILMAAFGAPALRQAALAEGAYGYLAKPFRLQDSLGRCATCLAGLTCTRGEQIPPRLRQEEGGLWQGLRRHRSAVGLWRLQDDRGPDARRAL